MFENKLFEFGIFLQPLSDISLDVGDGIAYGNGAIMTGSVTSNTNLSKFHRSMSMGQGWTGQSLANRYGYQPDENNETKVVMRRKNNKVCDAGKIFISFNLQHSHIWYKILKIN